jgi:hypothetical protein
MKALSIALLAGFWGLAASSSPADHATWLWSSDLPKELRVVRVRPTGRAPAAVDRLFEQRVTLPRILQALGPPDAFGRQGIHSRTDGTAADLPSGGTLRFLLSDGGELHVSTSDFAGVTEAIRWSRTGKGKLLAK